MQILLEHAGTPGTLYEDVLIFGGGGGVLNEMVNLNEAADMTNHKPIKFRGKFQEAEAINKNKRMYPFAVLDMNVKRLSESMRSGGLCGELDHPADSIIHFANASHKVTKLWWENNTLMGEGIILSTPAGRILRALINDGVSIGISSRGVGNGKVNEEGVLVIGESYKLITFDAVADPSTYAAFQQKVSGKTEENVIASKSQSVVSSTKNESSGIYNFNKEAVLACLGGIVREQTGIIKEKI
jgi:hypothetical protein